MRATGAYRNLIPRDYGLEPKQVRMRLVEYGLTVKEFAELVGIGPDHMSNILNGHRDASLVVRLRIQDVLRSLHDETARKEA